MSGNTFQAERDPHLDRFVAAVVDQENDVSTPDMPWVRTLARQFPGQTIDLGCGAGRLTRALGQAGAQVTGIDHSPAMLQRFAERLANETEQVQQRIRQVHGSLVTVDHHLPPGSVSLAVCGFNTFAALLTVDEQVQFLTAVCRCLAPGGCLALVTGTPDSRALSIAADMAAQVYEHNVWYRGERLLVKRYDLHRHTDETAQLRHLSLLYDIRSTDGGRRRMQFDYAARYCTRWELVHLLARCGFTSIEVAGGYAGEPYAAANGLLVLTATTPRRP